MVRFIVIAITVLSIMAYSDVSRYDLIKNDTTLVNTLIRDSLINQSIKLPPKKTWYGKASWYGNLFHGKLTASGRPYHENELTVAHKTLPFGTKLRVTNMTTNKSVEVVVTDRGPFIKGREIDLSKRSASMIGLDSKVGVMNVKIEMI